MSSTSVGAVRNEPKPKLLGNPAYVYSHIHICVVHGIGDQMPNETALNFMNNFLRALPQGSGYKIEVDNLIESVDDIRDDPAPGKPPRSFHPAFLVFTSDHERRNYVIGFSEVYWQNITNAYLAKNDGAPPIPIFIWAHSVNTRMLNDTSAFKSAPSTFKKVRKVIDDLEKLLGLLKKLAVIFKETETFLRILNRFAGDVQMYAESDEIRGEINERFRSVMSRTRDFACRTVNRLPGAGFDSTSPKVYVVAHSEGTVVAYSTLVEAAQKNEPWFGNVRGLVTMGSPLDKHYFIWHNRFRLREFSSGPSERKIIWHNYWDQNDPVGYGLKELFKDADSDAHKLFHLGYDSGFVRYPVPGLAHVGYWSDPAIHRDIIHRVMNLTPNSAPTSVKSKWWSWLVPIGDRVGWFLGRLFTLAAIGFFLYKLFTSFPPKHKGSVEIKDVLGYLMGLVVSCIVWQIHTRIHRGLIQMWRYAKGADTAAEIEEAQEQPLKKGASA